MSFTITKDAGKVTNKGGGVLKIWEVLEDGTPVTPMVVTDLGLIQDSSFKDSTPTEDITDETLDVVVTVEGQREVMLSGALLQSGIEMTELANETRGKFYGAYKKFADLDGYHQEMFMGIGKITPSVEITTPNPRPPFEMKFSILRSNAIYDSTACGLIGAYTTSATIPSGSYYKTVKTSIA